MDLTALRVERIRMGLQAAERLVELQSRRHIAVLIVGLTFLGSSLFAGIAGQLGPVDATALALTSLAVVAYQLSGLASLARTWQKLASEARSEVDALIQEEGESDVDAETDAR